MKHSEFIDKIAVAKAAYDFFIHHDKDVKLTAKHLGIHYLSASSRIAYYSNHRLDPVAPWFGELDHKKVLRASGAIPMDSYERSRNALIDHFRVEMDGSFGRTPSGIPKPTIKMLTKCCNLRYFEMKGVPYVHWSEAKTEAIHN